MPQKKEKPRGGTKKDLRIFGLLDLLVPLLVLLYLKQSTPKTTP